MPTLLLLIGFARPLPALCEERKNFYGFRLESLSSFEPFEAASLRGNRSIWVLFQPACGSCKAQLKDLGCLPQTVERVAVGIRGNRDQLIGALRPSGFQGRKLMASPALEKVLNTEATPTLYLINTAGLVQKSIQGLVSCEKLKTEFAAID